MSPGTVAETAGGATGLRRRTVAWGWLVLMSAASLLLHGYQVDGGDNDLWIPLMKRWLDPSLYPGDMVAASAQGALSFWTPLMAGLSGAVGFPAAFFTVYLVAHAALLAGTWKLGEDILGDGAAAALAVALLCFGRPIGGTATTTLETLLLPRLVSQALGTCALVLRGRPAVSGGLLGAAMLLHPIGVPPFAAALGAWTLADRARWRGGLVAASALAVVSLPVFVRYAAVAGAGPSGFARDGEWMALLQSAAPYAFVASWQPAHWLFVLTPSTLLVAWLASSLPGGLEGARTAAIFALASVGAVLAGVAVGEGLGLPAIVALQPARGLVLWIVLGHVAAGAWIAGRLREGRVPGAVAGALFAAMLCGFWGWSLLLAAASLLASRGRAGARLRLGLAAALLLAGTTGFADVLVSDVLLQPARAGVVLAGGALGALLSRLSLSPAAGRSAALAAVALLVAWRSPAPLAVRPEKDEPLRAWAREATPRDATFRVPKEARGFRAWAERTTWLEPADGGPSLFSRRHAEAWHERRTDSPPASGPGVDYIVRTRAEPELPLPVVHSDAAHVVHAASPRAIAAARRGGP